MIYPGIAISLAVFGTNLLGDALRDDAGPAPARELTLLAHVPATGSHGG